MKHFKGIGSPLFVVLLLSEDDSESGLIEVSVDRRNDD